MSSGAYASDSTQFEGNPPPSNPLRKYFIRVFACLHGKNKKAKRLTYRRIHQRRRKTAP